MFDHTKYVPVKNSTYLLMLQTMNTFNYVWMFLQTDYLSAGHNYFPLKFHGNSKCRFQT